MILLFWFWISYAWHFRGVSYVEETNTVKVKNGLIEKDFLIVRL